MADSTNHEQLVSEFCGLIGTSSEDDALHFLSESRWNLSNAVAKYFGAQENDVNLLEATHEEPDEVRNNQPYTGPSILAEAPKPSVPLVNSNTQRGSDSVEADTVHANQPRIHKSVSMRHLCERCSNLRVSDKPSERFQNHRVVETVSKPSYENVEYLAQSAQGSTGKGCHFCALILRSLKSHEFIGTDEEEARLPRGPIDLDFSEQSDLSLVAVCGAVVGYPIQLSLGMG